MIQNLLVGRWLDTSTILSQSGAFPGAHALLQIRHSSDYKLTIDRVACIQLLLTELEPLALW
jgi:hypothetical protein